MKHAVNVALRHGCVVLDSPHSGVSYPEDFGYACALADLRRAEDTHVDRLFSFAPSMNASLVCARFPRSYIDANRSVGEIDDQLFDTPWPADTQRSDKVALGKGLVWRLTDDGEPIYDRKLSHAEVTQRIEECWLWYHLAVAAAIELAHDRHGCCVHLNCHSMPSVAGSHATLWPGARHPDIVVGDRDGTTSTPALTRWIADFFRQRGFCVGINDPYKGVELVRRHSNPAVRRCSVQLEINRALYMDERTLVPTAGFGPLQEVLRELVGGLLARGALLCDARRPAVTA